MTERRAFYAATGSRLAELWALLHPPYTLWHLSYVAIGAGLATRVDGLRLAGALGAFFLGLGVAAHAFDEVHSRPLATHFSDRILWAIGVSGLAGATLIAGIGAVVISPWVLAWAGVGVVLAPGYGLEWSKALHSDTGFALAWGAFPVLVGYWAQTETLSLSAVAAAGAAALLSMAQRRLSTPARFVRRRTRHAEASFDDGSIWDRARMLATWEGPLQALVWVVPLLAVALLLQSS